jgi:hypothetical protein
MNPNHIPVYKDNTFQAKPAFGAVVKTAHSGNVNPNL